MGLKADGTVIAVGDNSYKQCDVNSWTDILAICCGANFTMGLKKDYTVVFTGDNSSLQGEVSHWTDIIAISGGIYHSIGLRMDGSLVFAGSNDNNQQPDSTVLFSTHRHFDTIETTAIGSSTEYIYDTDNVKGPWMYVSNQGAVVIIMDETQKRMPLRADLFSASGSLPKGYVTMPEATGDVIIMPTELPDEIGRIHRCVFSITGDYIGFTRNRKGVMMRQGIVYYDRNETTTMAIHPNGTLLTFYKEDMVTAEALKDQGVEDSFSFGPILVKDGKFMTRDVVHNKVATMRVGLGYACPYHFIAVVTCRDSNMFTTFTELANIFLDYHCKEAYNLDGGHSTTMTFMGKQLTMFTLINVPHSNIRGLSDVMGFLTSEQVQPPKSK